MIKKEEVLKKLKTVVDPEININIVDLGLIYDVRIDQNSKFVEIDMTLTTQGCPLKFEFVDLIETAVKKIKDVKNVKINFVWEPAWTPERVSDKIRKEFGI
ncbi:MAG: metal-sulfur cluster assembly factor [Patescibacteria group bacterium]|nr:metal-sulfur cluster assembly factor [Patescibacteria group bacterium]